MGFQRANVMRTKIKRHSGPHRPGLTVRDILVWADAHRRRTGQWPQAGSGLVKGGPHGEKWRSVDTALRIGLRGLPGGTSLPQLLAEQRQVRNRGQLPPLTQKQILAWADLHRQRTGKWPTSTSGPVASASGETWKAVDQALRIGARGLRAHSSLAQLLGHKRQVRNLQHLPRLSVHHILAWADAHHQRTGHWPDRGSGPVIEASGETWTGIDSALTLGRRGFPGGSSLARLLATARGVRNPKQRPVLTVKRVLAWARAHRRRTGQWPTRSAGTVLEAPGETWSGVYAALVMGCRGLPAGWTLARLLRGQTRQLSPRDRLPLTLGKILAWADAHYRRTRAWPNSRSGSIPHSSGETWRGVDQALHRKQRSLNAGVTLVQLLSAERGVRTRRYPPVLTTGQVLDWADDYHRRTGHWPSARSGSIDHVSGESWRSVDTALRQASRGLRKRTTLARFLARRRGARNRTNLRTLRIAQLLSWAEAHHARTGMWPSSEAGSIDEAPGETWKGVDMALRGGYRGLPGGTTLARLLVKKKGVRNRVNLPGLSARLILHWAEAYFKRTGSWPTRNSGIIAGAPAETWHGVDLALKAGYRGLPGRSSLARLLQRPHRRVATEVR